MDNKSIKAGTGHYERGGSAVSAIDVIKLIILFLVIIADIVCIGYDFYAEIKSWLQNRKNKK